MRNFISITSIILICIYSFLGFSQGPIIQTKYGKVEGNFNKETKINIFKGIPFAAPPIEDLRWKAPVEPNKWKGVLSCKEFSASPIQNKPEPFYCWSEEFIAQPEPLSEDCLYLNVWTSSTEKKQKLPVMVWIYGGGFSSGSTNCAIYDGEEMAKKGVVFVSLNYRVGVLGFMAHPELSQEANYGTSGNYGLMDQSFGIKWVKENIEAFGGDPENITIVGQSAGSFSVNAQIASPVSKGLFQKAIAQSGGLLSGRFTSSLEQAEKLGLELMEKAGVNSLAELRKIPAGKIQEISNQVKGGRFGAILDGYFLPSNIKTYFEEGKQNKVGLMTGWVTGDASLMGGKPEDARKNLIGFAGLPAHLLSTNNLIQPTYVYEFNFVPVDKPNFPNYGAFHTSEVPFALHTLHLWDRPWREIDLKIEEIMSSYWVNFVKTGNPNGNGLPLWKPYEKGDSILSIEEKIESVENDYLKDFLLLTNK